MMSKDKTIEHITQRILDEHKKHSNMLPDEWAKIAAHKIYASHLKEEVDKLKLKIINPVGDIKFELDLDWGDEHLDRFIAGSKLVVEGDKDMAIYSLKEYKSNKNEDE